MTFSGCPSANSPLHPSWPVLVPLVAYPRRAKLSRVRSLMDPHQPPLPVATYLPFQPDLGIRTSTLMSESEVGFMVASTRHAEGTPVASPAAVMVVSGRCSCKIDSQ